MDMQDGNRERAALVMEEEGERAEGHRRTGPNPGPYPWPGPGPGYHVSDNAEPRRPHAQQRHHHSVKQKNTLSVLYDHRPEYNQSSRSQDLSGSAGSRKMLASVSSAPRQDETHGNEDHYLCCRPYEVGSKTSTKTTSITGAHFRNKGLSNKFHSLRGPKGLGARTRNQDARHGSALPSHGRHTGSAASERIHGPLFSRLKRKHRNLKTRDPALSYPMSVHPVQPPDLRCKNLVNRESFRKTLGGEIAAMPIPETQSAALCPKKKMRATFKLVCAETSNPDIKVSNIDEASAATFGCIERTETKIADILGDGSVLNKHKQSPSNCQPTSISHDKTAEYSLMIKHNIRINRGVYVPCPELYLTAPEDEDLKMERYFPREEDSVECSIHTCGMSSSMVSGVTLEHEMSPSEKLARVLPQRYTPQTALSTDTVASLAEKEVIKVPNPKDKIGSSRVGKFLRRASYTSLARDHSFDDVDSGSNILSRYRDSCNDNDHIGSNISRAVAPQGRSVKISNATERLSCTERIVNVRIPNTGETIVHKEERNLHRDGNRSPDILQVLTNTAQIIQGMEGRIPGTDESSSPDTRTSAASEDAAKSNVENLKATENLPNTEVVIIDNTKILPNSLEKTPCATDITVNKIPRLQTKPSENSEIPGTSHCSENSEIPGTFHYSENSEIPGTFHYSENSKIPGTSHCIPFIDDKTSESDKTILDTIRNTVEILSIPDKILPDTNKRFDTIYNPNTSANVGLDDIPKDEGTIEVVELTPLQKDHRALPLECQSSSVQTNNDINVNINEKSRINMILLFSSALESDCSEEIRLKMGSKDLVIDIREENGNTNGPCELKPTFLEKGSKTTPLVTAGVLEDDETTKIPDIAFDKVVVTTDAKTENDDCTKDLFHDVGTTVVLPLHQQTNDANVQVEESLQINEFRRSRTKITRFAKPKSFDSKVGSEGACVQEQGSGVRDCCSSEELQNRSRSHRRNTVPKASTEMIHFQRESFLFKNRVLSHSNEIPTAELETIEIEDKAIFKHAKECPSDNTLKNFVSDEKNFGSGKLISVIKNRNNYNSNAECEVSFTTSTETSESSENYETESKTSVTMICSYKMEGTPDENSVGVPYDFQKEVSPRISEKICDEQECKSATISPIKSYFNHLEVIYSSFSKNDLQHASKDATLFVNTTEKVELLNKNLPGMELILSGSNADNPPLLNPNVDESQFNQGINSLGGLHLKATQGGFINNLRLPIQRTAEKRCNKCDILEKFPSKAESFVDQTNVPTPTDENTSSEHGKMKALVEDYLTAGFRRNSNDMNSSRENPFSHVQSKAPSAKTSMYTNTSGQLGSPIQCTEGDDNMECFSQVSTQDVGCPGANQSLGITNENNRICYDAKFSGEDRSKIDQCINRHDLNSPEVQNEEKREDFNHSDLIKMGIPGRSAFECQYCANACYNLENGNFEVVSRLIDQTETKVFSVGLQDPDRRSLTDMADSEVEKRLIKIEDNSIRNNGAINFNIVKRFDVAKTFDEQKCSNLVENVVDEVNNSGNECKFSNDRRLCSDNRVKDVVKISADFDNKERSSCVAAKARFDLERKSLKNEGRNFESVSRDFYSTENKFIDVGNSSDRVEKTGQRKTDKLESISCCRAHDDCKNESVQKIPRGNLFEDQYHAELQPEIQNSMKWSSLGNLGNSCFQKVLRSGQTSNQIVCKHNVRNSSSKENYLVDGSAILNGSHSVGHQSDFFCKGNCSLCGGESEMEKPSVQGSVKLEGVKSSSETASTIWKKSSQEVTEMRVASHADTNASKNSHELTGSRTTYEYAHFESRLVEAIPLGLEIGSVSPCTSTMRAKRDSLKEQTREMISCDEIIGESEDLVSMAEQLGMTSFEVEVNEENAAVAELTDYEGNLPHEIDTINEGNIEEETVSLNNGTEKTSELIMIKFYNEFIKQTGFKGIGREISAVPDSEEQFLSSVHIASFDSGCQISAPEKVADVVKVNGNVANVLEKEVDAPGSCSQNFTDNVQFPQVIFPNDEAGACKSFLSLNAIRGGAMKSVLKSGASSRGSERVEWTPSVNDENGTGVETRPSIDIITLNDTTDDIEVKKQSNIEDSQEIVESPVISCSSMSSHNTHVLKNPSSSPSVGTCRFLSEMSCGGVCKMRFPGVQKTDDSQTRTKLMKKCFERRLEMRKRWHLFETIPSNVSEVYGSERKRKPFIGYAAKTGNGLEKSQKEMRHSSSYSVDGGKTTRRAKGGCSRELENFEEEHSLPKMQGVPSSNEDKFEQYRSISDLYVTRSAQIASDSEDSENDVMGSPKHSVSPSLLNLGRFTPSKSGSWATFRHRQAISNRTAFNVTNVPSTQSRTSNRCTSRLLHSDGETDCSRSRPDSKKRIHRSSDSSLNSPNERPCPISGIIDRNMHTDFQDVHTGRDPDVNQECEYGASCLASFDPGVSHAPRVVTFENIPSPRSSLHRYTLTPRGESIQTFDPLEGLDDARQRARSPALLHFSSEDCFLQVSRSSIDASACCVDELSSADQMSHQGRLANSVGRNRHYEEVPFISTSHESIQRRRSGTTANSNADRFQTIWPKVSGYLSNKTSCAVQTHPTTRSHSDLRVLTASKTTLLSLAEAGVYSTSRLSSPTPSDIPSPPPNLSPNRHLSQTKVDVAVGVNTLDCDPNSGPLLSESPIPASALDKSRDSMATIIIPISTVGKHKSSIGSANASSIPMAVYSSLAAGISNIGRSLDDSKDKLDDTVPIIVPSNIYPKNFVTSRGVVTTDSTDVLNPLSTYKTTREADHLQQNDGATEKVEIERSRERKRCAVSFLRTPPIVAKIAGSETTRANMLGTTEERHKSENISDDSIDTTDSSSNGPMLETDEIRRINRPVVIGGHYRFSLAGQRICKYSDFMGDINTAVPSRGAMSRSFGSTYRLSQSGMLGGHVRFIGTRILEASCSSIGMNSSDIIDPQECHRERESYAQKPRPKMIKRPADVSCRSSTFSKSSNINRSSSNEARPKEGNKQALPPAALDQNEESYDSRHGAGRLSNVGVIADLPTSNYGAAPGSGPTSFGGASAVRFSEFSKSVAVGGFATEPPSSSTHSDTAGTYPRYVGEGRYGPNQSAQMQMGSVGQSHYGPNQSAQMQMGSVGQSHYGPNQSAQMQMGYVGQSHYGPNQSAQMQMGSVGQCHYGPNQSAQMQMGSVGQCHYGPNQSAQMQMAQPPTFFGEKVNLPNSPLGQNVCVSIKFRDDCSCPICSCAMTTTTGQESNVTQPSSPCQSLDHTGPNTSQHAPVSESPCLSSRESDAISGIRKPSQNHIPESASQRVKKSSESAPKRREHNGRSSSTQGIYKQKSSTRSNKAVHKTGSKTKRGSANKHGKQAIHTTSITSQTSTSSLDKIFNPLLIGDDGRTKNQCISWDSTFEDGGEDNAASYIAKKPETADDVPVDPSERQYAPAPQGGNADSVATGTFDFASKAPTRSVTRPEYMRHSAPTSSEGTSGHVSETFDPSAQSYTSRQMRSRSEPESCSTERDARSLAMTQDASEKDVDAEAEKNRIEKQQTICKADCKGVKYPPPGRRHSLYTYPVGYFPPPRPRHPLAATACRGKIFVESSRSNIFS